MNTSNSIIGHICFPMALQEAETQLEQVCHDLLLFHAVVYHFE